MKVAMKLTLDGLLRALRAKMHQMADEAETGYVRGPRRREAEATGERDIRTGDDDVSGD